MWRIGFNASLDGANSEKIGKKFSYLVGQK